MNELPHHTAECWTRIGFWTVCDVTSHAGSPASLNQILNERRENTLFEQWRWKLPPPAKLPNLRHPAQWSSNIQEEKHDFDLERDFKTNYNTSVTAFIQKPMVKPTTQLCQISLTMLLISFFGLIPRLWSCWTSCQVVLSCHVLHASILFVSALVCPFRSLGRTWCCFFLFL